MAEKKVTREAKSQTDFESVICNLILRITELEKQVAKIPVLEKEIETLKKQVNGDVQEVNHGFQHVDDSLPENDHPGFLKF